MSSDSVTNSSHHCKVLLNKTIQMFHQVAGRVAEPDHTADGTFKAPPCPINIRKNSVQTFLFSQLNSRNNQSATSGSTRSSNICLSSSLLLIHLNVINVFVTANNKKTSQTTRLVKMLLYIGSNISINQICVSAEQKLVQQI
ncbi:hypothetical protein CHARACLAT_022039 [Characodon lateralis]|uniref:Uncharacterized protein n=1 Tax=Characodon lateralis TaxID=208331 RepID=A0ABU7EWT8_9TELE|nr:hypothetical protein [Characodon lateralis]